MEKEWDCFSVLIFIALGMYMLRKAWKKESIFELFLRQVAVRGLKTIPTSRVLNKETIAHYYALSLVTSIKAWLMRGDEEISVDERMEAYSFLLTHSIFDIIQKESK